MNDVTYTFMRVYLWAYNNKLYIFERIREFYDFLILFLLEPKVTSLCPGQPARPCSLTRSYTVGWRNPSFHLDIPKNDKWNVDYSI